MRENLCELSIRQGTVSQNTQGHQKNSPQINDPVKKWANELKRAFSKEEVQMTKKKYEKMITIPGHKGNAYQNHIKIPPHSCLNNYHQELNNKCRWNPHTLLVGM
jgi:hypothetical protein